MPSSVSPSPTPDNPILMSSGYGYIPKSVMQDRGLSPTAKAIYAYLCSFSGRAGEAWPSVERMMADLGVCREAFYTHMKALLAAGLVSVRREKLEGRYARNTYALCGRTEPCAEKQDKEKQHAEEQDTEKQHAEIPQPEKPDANNNSLINNTPNNNSLINNNAMDDDEAPHQSARAREALSPDSQLPTPSVNADACERSRIVDLMARAGEEAYTRMKHAKDSCKGDIRREFKKRWGREALEAEADMLAGLLAVCDAAALAAIMRKASGHAPVSPARYVKRIVERYRSDAVQYRFIRSPTEKLTLEVMEKEEERTGTV
jgi:hypothetical protein